MPDAEPTLEELFPTLAPALRGMEGAAGRPDTLRGDPEHHGVTDADIESYFTNRLNGVGRTLAPVVPGQVPVGPTFRSGSTGAPPQGGVEAGGPGDEPARASADTPATPPRQANQPPNPSPPVQPAEMPQPFQTEGDGQDGDDEQDPSTPDGTAPDSTDDQVAGSGAGEGGAGSAPVTPPAPQFVEVNVNGQAVQVPVDRVLAYEEFNARLAADPNLQRIIQEYVTTGRVSGQNVGEGGIVPAAQPSPAPQQQQAQSPFANPPEEFQDDPALMALWRAQEAAYNANQSQIAALVQAQQAQQQQAMVEAQRRNEQYAEAGVAQFHTRYNTLSAEEVAQLRGVAARMNVIPSLLSGIDPVTGGVAPTDPIRVVERAMEIAYNTIPEYRTRETQQATTAAQQQAAQANQRKRKAGSLSGSSGSVPRTTPAPTTPQGQRQAMLAEVGEMMAGTWTGNGS